MAGRRVVVFMGLRREARGLVFRGTRPSSGRWHGHGYTTKRLILLHQRRLIVVVVHKQRWREVATGTTVHGRPPRDMSWSHYGLAVVFSVTWAWMTSPRGLHHTNWPWLDERPSRRTAQRWMARLLGDALGWQVAIRAAVVDRLAPTPLERVFPAGLPPPETVPNRDDPKMPGGIRFKGTKTRFKGRFNIEMFLEASVELVLGPKLLGGPYKLWKAKWDRSKTWKKGAKLKGTWEIQLHPDGRAPTLNVKISPLEAAIKPKELVKELFPKKPGFERAADTPWDEFFPKGPGGIRRPKLRGPGVSMDEDKKKEKGKEKVKNKGQEKEEKLDYKARWADAAKTIFEGAYKDFPATERTAYPDVGSKHPANTFMGGTVNGAPHFPTGDYKQPDGETPGAVHTKDWRSEMNAMKAKFKKQLTDDFKAKNPGKKLPKGKFDGPAKTMVAVEYRKMYPDYPKFEWQDFWLVGWSEHHINEVNWGGHETERSNLVYLKDSEHSRYSVYWREQARKVRLSLKAGE